MNRRDIQLELASRIRELREWIPRLEPASPALADLFKKQAEHLEARSPRDFDSYGMTMMSGKINGLVAAASILLDEWTRHRG